MKFKKTRIAFSVSCGVLSLSFIGLWIRSQSTADFIQFRVNSTWGGQAGTVLGSAVFFIADSMHMQHSWVIGSRPCSKSDMPPNYSTLWGKFGVELHANIYSFMVPCWFLVLLTGSAAAALLPYRYIQWRFSLRTLLLVTTAVAVALWFIVWMTRR